MIKKFSAFTLGEILIALAVIGVVAVLVFPQVLVGIKASKAEAQFNTAHALIGKAIAEMDADDISTDPTKYPTRTFFPKFKTYNKYTIDCGVTNTSPNTSVCPSSSNYKNLTGQTTRHDLLDDGAIVLNNGMMFAVENCVKCTYGEDHNIWIVVDINGKNKNPNRLGYDLFAFQVFKDGEILPLGAPGTDKMFSEHPEDFCKYKINNNSNSSQYNGYTCAYYASTDQDYFKTLFKGY